MIAWRFAGAPTNRSPVFVKPTTEGVSRLPSELGRVLLALDLNHRHAVLSRDDLVGYDLALLGHLFVPAAHEPLDRVNRVLRIDDRLAFRRRADQPLSRLREADYRGSKPASFRARAGTACPGSQPPPCRS